VQVLPFGATTKIVSLLDIMEQYSVDSLLSTVTRLVEISHELKSAQQASVEPSPELAGSLSTSLFQLFTLGKQIELDSALMVEIAKLHADCKGRISCVVAETRLDYILGVVNNPSKEGILMTMDTLCVTADSVCSYKAEPTLGMASCWSATAIRCEPSRLT
jgi:hypothetical protein